MAAAVVEGVVLDSVTDAAVEGAAVFIGMSGGSGRTDASGVYTIEGVEPGVYDVRIFKSGFQLQAITGVNVGEEGRTRLNVALDPLGAPPTEGRRPDAPETEAPEELDEEDPSERDIFELDAFTVTAAEAASKFALDIDFQRVSTVQLDVLLGEEMERFGASDVAGAIQSVAGVTISDGKYAVVRGLSDRFSITQLNGLFLPSPDPDRPSVPLDIFPAGIFETIETRKIFTPNLPGEASGGAINLKLIESPEERVIKLGFGIGINSESQDRWISSERGGSSDYFASGAGDRELESEVSAQATGPLSSINDVFSEAREEAWAPFLPVHKSPRPDLSGSFFFGDSFEFGRDTRLGVLLAYSQGTDSRTRFQKRKDVSTTESAGADQTFGEAFIVNEFGFSQLSGTLESQVSAVLGLSLDLTDAHRLQYNLMFLRNGVDEALEGDGGLRWTTDFQNSGGVFAVWDDFQGDTAFAAPYRLNEVEFAGTNYAQRTLFNNQVGGSHDFEDSWGLSFDWTLMLTNNEQIEPDSWDTRGSGQPPYRIRRETTQDSLGFSGEVSWHLDEVWRVLDTEWGNRMRVGYYLEDTSRDFEQSQRAYETRTAIAFPDITVDAFYSEPLRTGQAEGTRAVEAGFAMLELNPITRLQLIGGYRLERTELSFDGFGASPRSGNYGPGLDPTGAEPIDQTDVLPSVALNLDLSEELKFRLSYSETIARPIFREIAPYPIVNLQTNELEVGNPGRMAIAGRTPFEFPVILDALAEFRGLEVSDVQNLDIRLEWYPVEGAFLAAGYFKKEVSNPIERVFVPQTSSLLPVFTWINNDFDADLRGVELEAQSDLTFLHQSLDFVSVGGNVTLIEAEVGRSRFEQRAIEQGGNGGTPGFLDYGFTRSLSLQPELLANVYVNWVWEPWGTDLTLSATHTGMRLDVPATGSRPDIYLDATTRLNLVLIQEIARWEGLSLKASARNFTNPSIRRVASTRETDLRLYTETGAPVEEVPLESYKEGVIYSISASYTF